MWLDAFCVRKTKPFYSNVSEDQKIAGFFFFTQLFTYTSENIQAHMTTQI